MFLGPGSIGEVGHATQVDGSTHTREVERLVRDLDSLKKDKGHVMVEPTWQFMHADLSERAAVSPSRKALTGGECIDEGPPRLG